MDLPDYAHGAQGGAKGHWNPDGSWTWDTGNYAGTTIPTNQAQGNSDLYNQSVGDPAAAKKAQDQFAYLNGEGKYEGNGNHGVHGTTDLGGVLSNTVGAKAPGGMLDTTQADLQRQRMQQLIQSLQQQATTGNGAWQQSFAQAVKQASGNASAIGQSEQAQARSGAAGALRNIGNAQGAIGQRAVGEGSILRQQSMNDAQNQLGQILGNLGAGDISQAAESAGVNQQRRIANDALNEEGQKVTLDYLQAGGQGLTALLSDGGRVPGRPKTFGDDSRNDTVPAMLSPGEIVVPRTKASDPEAAAAFARAVAMRHGVRRMADGGYTGWKQGDTDPSVTTGFNWMGEPQEAPSIENGALLDTSAYDQTRGQMDLLGSQFGARAAGDNSIAGTIAQQQSDAQMQAALQAENNRRGAISQILAASAEQGAKGAGEAGAKRGNEQAAGQNALAQMLETRRAQEQALSGAQQKAAWNNTMLNTGITLQNQQLLRNALASAGQVAQRLSSMGGKGGPYNASGNDVPDQPGTQNTLDFNENLQPESAPGDFPEGGEGVQSAAYGGRIGYSGGGSIRRNFVRAVMGGARPPRLMDVMHAQTPQELPEERVARKSAEHEEEEGGGTGGMSARKRAEHAEETGEGYADGGEIEGRRDSGPVYQPINFGGAPSLPPEAVAEIASQFSAPPNPTAPRANVALPSRQAFAPGMTGSAPMDLEARQGGNPLDPAARALATIPGLRRREAAQEAPAPDPPAATKAAPRMGVPREAPVDTSAFDEERKTIEAMGATKEAQAREEARAQAAYGEQLQAAAMDQQRRTKLAQEEGSARMARFDAAVEDMKRIDTSVDPNRYWASRSTGQKVLGIIGLALGTLGSNDGTNKAAQMMGQAIDRDIDAQKAEAAARLRKGEAALAASQTAYGMHRQLFQDDLAATAAAKASLLEIADNKLKTIASTYASPQAKQNAALLSAQLQQSKAKFIQEAQTHAVDSAYKRAETAKAYAEAGKASGATGLTPERQKAVDDVETATRNIRSNIAKAKDIISRKGTFELTGPDQAELQRALSLVATDSARLKDPGSTVREGELAAAKREIGVEGGELGTSNATAMKLLDSFEKSVEERRRNAYQARGLGAP